MLAEGYGVKMDLTKEKILVTGSSGLVGKSLVKKLQEMGCADIRVFRSNEYSLESQPQSEALFSKNSDVTIIFHLAAAVGGIIANKEKKADFCTSNLLMNTFVLKYAEQMCKNIKKICLVGSGCVYPDNSPIPMQEDNLWNGMPESNTRTYGLVKRLLHVQSMAYRDQHNLSSIVILPTNIYGPMDNFSLRYSHVIAALIRKINDAKQNNLPEVVLFGTGKATRDFVFSDDLSLAMIRLMEKYDSSEPVNVASGEEISINELAVNIKSILGYKGNIIFDNKNPDGQSRRKFDITRLKNVIGEFPYTDLNSGLKKTIDWYLTTPKEFIRK